MTAADPQSSLEPSAPAASPADRAGSGADWQGHVSTVAQKDQEGWVTARPPKAKEIVQRIFGFPGLIRRHWDLVTTSVRRELESRFSGTVLGWFWPLFHPLFLFIVYYTIFVHLLEFKLEGLPEEQKSGMGVYMFVGITVWAAVAETLNRGTNVIVENGNLIKKLAFPSEILPLNLTVVSMVTLLFAMVMFILACFVTPMWAAPGAGLTWVPLLLLVQGVFIYGLTLLLSTLQVFLRDTLQVVAAVTTVWMFATPIFWVPEVLKGAAQFMPLMRLNPVYHLVQAWRGAVMGDVYVEPNDEILGGYVVSADAVGGHIAVFSVWAIAFYVIGFAFFVLCQRRFADEV